MAAIRQWLLGTVACALLVSAAAQICPEGALRKLVRFTGALLLLLTMLRPLTELSLPGLAWDAERYREAVAQTERVLAVERENTLRRGIAAQWEAYIEDKAESLGAQVQAETELGEDGAPERVTLRGAYSEVVAAFLASELGIAKEKQVWNEGD